MVVGHGADGSGAAILRLMPADATRDALAQRLDALGVPYELFPCDPALADTAAFCAAYGFDPDQSANTILVIGKSDPPRYAACVVLATTPTRRQPRRQATGSARARRRSRHRT